jgi:hypothetical protein
MRVPTLSKEREGWAVGLCRPVKVISYMSRIPTAGAPDSGISGDANQMILPEIISMVVRGREPWFSRVISLLFEGNFYPPVFLPFVGIIAPVRLGVRSHRFRVAKPPCIHLIGRSVSGQPRLH